MFKLKLYKYDSTQENNGYRGQDFSKYVLQGGELGEDITQVLDNYEITLTGLTQRENFAPETKFIADLVEFNVLEEVILSTLHLCVSSDAVSKPILSDDNYWDHHISFIEPSVIAQKRPVDNIAVTYKLKDVSLEERPAFTDGPIPFNITNSQYTPSYNFGETDGGGYSRIVAWRVGKYFVAEGGLSAINRNNEEFNNIYNNIESFNVDGNYYARFRVPKLAIMFGNKGEKTFRNIGYASIDYTINEYTLNDEYNPTNTWSGTFISNSALGEETYNAVHESLYENEWIIEGLRVSSGTTYRSYKKYTETTAADPTYITQEIPIVEDRKYTVTISLHQFEDNISSTGGLAPKFREKYTGTTPTKLLTFRYTYTGNTSSYLDTQVETLTTSQVSGYGHIVTYGVDTKTIVYTSSTPYSALALLQKAIINSAIYEKQDGVYIADVNNSNLPFYIDDNFVDELSATVIIENFYNQKNLWEIMVEVGNYIHAIPELKFGSDDRFIVTFNRLGRTDEKQDLGNKISIYNSRSVEDYISATSSYITNMVQLGGYIEEWVVPKTTDETLLVSNDTAEIVLSKPIIELLDIKVRRNSDNAIADLTTYIYEENVYKTLSLDFDVLPNRGIAMYYSLGTNKITGGQYRLPQANTNIYSDYSFKKVIYSAFNGYPSIAPAPTTGYWTDLKISDYSFYVRYRTKDSVRQNHIRPDLRKYLLNSKYDRYPQHNQFNNQTDVVVDSIKFGNNMFGKLIKTGNNTYNVWEWHDKYADIKHKGELYRINEELYYVATITHYIFSSYIISKITYSKDYNELSNIIGIPSEPRFYEISEQSLIWRELAINDILLLTDNINQLTTESGAQRGNFMENYDHLADLILGEGTEFAKYAVSVYKGDKDADNYDQTVGEKDNYIEIINAVNAYSSENTLTYEWDMLDNYSAGDKVIDVDPNTSAPINEQYYNSLRAAKYTDIYGKAALLDFFILGGLGNLTVDEIKALPESPISTKQGETRPFIGNYDILVTNALNDNNYNGRGLGLLKDCREAMSINYNLQMATNSDTFVLSPYVYLPKKKNLKIVLLAEEVNKLSAGYIDNSTIIAPIDKNGNQMSTYFDISINKTTKTNQWGADDVVSMFYLNLEQIFENIADEHFTGANGYPRIKGIAVLCDVSLDAGLDNGVSTIPYKTQFVVARNIPEFWDRAKALSSWYWGSPNKEAIFENKQ